MEKAAEKLKRARERPVIRNQTVACESEGEDWEIAPVRPPVPKRRAGAVSKEVHCPSLTVELRNMQNIEGRMGPDLKVILKGRQQQKWAIEGELKASKAALLWKGTLSTESETSVGVLEDKDDIKSGSHTVQRERFSQATGDFDTGL